jgi:hypothetical protein
MSTTKQVSEFMIDFESIMVREGVMSRHLVYPEGLPKSLQRSID